MTSILHRVRLGRGTPPAEYQNGKECTPGFHVFESDVERGSLCTCGKAKFGTIERGFVKAKRYECQARETE